jgi:hypothetical protein
LEYAVFSTQVNNSRFSINWGFLCAVMMNRYAKWYVSCDDDIEFYEAAGDIPARLDFMYQKGFCIAGFCNNVQQYGGLAACDSDGIQVAPGWLDGNAMFMAYEDVMKWGLTDSLIDQPITFFVEVELEHRYRVLSGKPLMVDLSKVYYRHRFRDDPEMAHKRNWNDWQGMKSGSDLWKLKYGLEVGDWNSAGVHQRIFDHVSHPERRKMLESHLMYNGLWTDSWPKMVQFAADRVRLIEERIDWDRE